MGSFENILQRSSISFSMIDSLEQFPQWMALYRYRNKMSDQVFIHHFPLLETLNWRAVEIALSHEHNLSKVQVYHALMANSESGTLIFDFDIQQQINHTSDGENTVVMLSTNQLMDSMEFVLKQIDELNMQQQKRRIFSVHPAELPCGAHLCLYKGSSE